MARVQEQVELTQRMLEDAARWYAENAIPVPFRRCHPRVLKQALEIAGHDWRRMTVEDDGAIVIHNQRVWTA